MEFVESFTKSQLESERGQPTCSCFRLDLEFLSAIEEEKLESVENMCCSNLSPCKRLSEKQIYLLTKPNPFEQLRELDGLRIMQRLHHKDNQDFHLDHKITYSFYSISNERQTAAAAPLYFAEETEGFFSRLNFHNDKQRRFNIVASDGTVVLSIQRPCKLCKKKIKVFHGKGTLIGTVKKYFSLLNANIQILDDHNKELLWASGPQAPDWQKLKIMRGNERVGTVKRSCQAMHSKTLLRDGDCFEILFPKDADACARWLLVASVLFMNVLWFENYHLFK